MKLLIASDIHGSAYYCEKLIHAFKDEEADKLLLLGDILYHGPRNDLPKDYNPKKVIPMLNDIASDILCVRGNCDSEVDQMVLDFPIMAEYAIFYVENHMIYCTHGHKLTEDMKLPLNEGDILLCGHTHVPKYSKKVGYLYMNPGSVSIPKEDSAHGYMILEGKSFLWTDFEGNYYKRIEI